MLNRALGLMWLFDLVMPDSLWRCLLNVISWLSRLDTCFTRKYISFFWSQLQEALEHLASIDLLELCNEAKVERCRATRDLRSCGRYVLHVLNSCGHASLCAECSGRCDFCPICRIPIPKKGTKTRLRLYYECTEAGLIAKRFDERFQEKDGEEQLTADVQHLYSLFDVALANNLVSLICHCIL